MTIREALRRATYYLGSHSTTPRLDAEVLLAFVRDCRRESLLASLSVELSLREYELYQKSIERRLNGEPVAYILGYKEFYGRKFIVTHDTLIPRPETELLVEHVLHYCFALREPFSILEIGTGSGCIISTLACAVPHSTLLVATDLSCEALGVARKNIERISPLPVQLFCANLLREVEVPCSPSIIVANLPYLSLDDYTSTPTPEIVYEPRSALVARNDGMSEILGLLEQIQIRRWSTVVFLEFLPRQLAQLQLYCHQHSVVIEPLFDLEHQSRFAKLHFSPNKEPLIF